MEDDVETYPGVARVAEEGKLVPVVAATDTSAQHTLRRLRHELNISRDPDEQVYTVAELMKKCV